MTTTINNQIFEQDPQQPVGETAEPVMTSASPEADRYDAPASQLADTAASTVTARDRGAAERMRRMRARRRETAAAQSDPLIFEREDWMLLLDPAKLPQRAGCLPNELGRVVLKELVDNALDTGATVTLNRADSEDMRGYTITDDGPGIDLTEVPRLFAVNRPLRSSKLKRLPLRGMLGHGLRVVMGAVAAYGGRIMVASRGHRLTLGVDPGTGMTQVLQDEPIPPASGTTITIALPWPVFTGDEAGPAKLTIEVAQQGQHYAGPSLPQWYSIDSLHRLFGFAPEIATVADVVQKIFGLPEDDNRPARSLSRDDVAGLHRRLCDAADTAPDIGHIGAGADLGEHYACIKGMTHIEGAEIPFCVEVWALCRASEERGDGHAWFDYLLLNRTPSVIGISGYSVSQGIILKGCGLQRKIPGPKTAQYIINISVIAPYIRLASDGKTPVLNDFESSIIEAVRKTAGAAYRAMARPPRRMSIKDAAWSVMKAAYLAASDDGKLPANARQIMYAARPAILEMTGREKLEDAYFTQNLLPDYMDDHPDICRQWDVVFDARGHFTEPHTGRSVPLGTIEVRRYLGDRPWLGPAVELASNERYPTVGPRNRYRNVLFIEKEGFDPLLQAARIAERFDIAVMSTKGMSNTASRQLLDRLAPDLDRVFVLHDFDIAGFSIFGTLASDGRRYSYLNNVPLIDLGLRLADATEMDLQAEPVTVSDWHSRCDTLRRHGATVEEIVFLRSRRVELNAMTSRQFIDFIESKFAEHGVAKVLPEPVVVEAHARRLIEQHLAEKKLAEIRDRLAGEAAEYVLPEDLHWSLQAHLDENPELAWDDALGQLIDRDLI